MKWENKQQENRYRSIDSTGRFSGHYVWLPVGIVQLFLITAFGTKQAIATALTNDSASVRIAIITIKPRHQSIPELTTNG
jgi:hypothetical protein